jgi:LmbE family N-acetylglucosaminyl deacetylase
MSLGFKPQRALVLAPHTDDGEFGCGGTIARFLEEGVEIFYVAFSICEESVPQGFEKDALAREVREATSTLGIPAKNLIIRSYPVRRFPERRQEILEDLVEMRRQLTPDLVFLPSLHDIHQDHQVIAAEGVRAFKAATLLGYEVPWNNLNMGFSTLVLLKETHFQKKLAALACYKTQQRRFYANEESIRCLAQSRGLLVSHKYAECFELVRLVF